jgi:hypothetical protein
MLVFLNGKPSYCTRTTAKQTGSQPNTSMQRENSMTICNNKHIKPFEIGQLVRFDHKSNVEDSFYGLDLVLDFRWDEEDESWFIYILSQNTGQKDWVWADWFLPVGEKR